jgi:drug/metabolite transporter (DMT)-like permease
MSTAVPARNSLWPGVPLALASAVLFGASTPFAKLLVKSSDPQLMAGLLYLGAGVGLAIGQACRVLLGVRSSEAPLRRTDAPWMIAIVAFGGVLGPLFLMLGLARTSAASGSLLLNLEGLATMGIAWVVFRENVDRRLLLGAAAILAGAAALSWQGRGVRVDQGGLLIATACFAWGIDNNLTRRLSAADPVIIALIKGLAAGSVNLALALLLGARLPSTGTIGAAFVVGFCGVGLSLVLFVLALRHLGSARTGAYFSLAPFLGAVIAIALLQEPITPQLLLAGLLMAFGVWLHLTERHAHDHTHEAIGHEHGHVHDDHHRHAHDGTVTEPHSHWHRHEPLRHRHAHYPDIHHRHEHG